MTQRRTLPRLPVCYSGTIRYRDRTVPCQVVDLTDKGVGLTTEEPVPVETDVALHLVMGPALAVRGLLSVIHRSDTRCGGAWLLMSPGDRQRLSRHVAAETGSLRARHALRTDGGRR